MAANRITLARLKELLAYDPDRGLFFWLVSRGGVVAGMPAGYATDDGYVCVRVEGRIYRAHILAWFYKTGEWPTRQVDHIDTKRDNNRWDNLRLASNGENGANKPKLSTNTTGFKGVTYDGKRGKYRAQVQKDGKKKHVGYFDCPTAAALAHDNVAAKLHGEFARLNVSSSPRADALRA